MAQLVYLRDKVIAVQLYNTAELTLGVLGMFLLRCVRKISSFLRTNWRTKVLMLVLIILLIIILYQRHLIQRALYTEQARKVESLMSGKEVGEVATMLRRLQKQEVSGSNHVALDKLALRLDNSAVLLGAGAELSQQKGDTCPEVYLGNQFYPYQYNNWGVEECDYGQRVEKLVTVVFQGSSNDQVERVTTSVWSEYPGVRVVVTGVGVGMKGVTSVETMAELVGVVDTKYVMLATDLDYVSNWTSIERGVRLLSEGGLGVVGVGGAVRNSSGHWHVSCYQLQSHYYRLEIRPGYQQQFRDCMVCDFVDGPLIIKTETLSSLDHDIPAQLAWLDLALARQGLVLSCPDILFFTTHSTAREALQASEAAWLALANKYSLLGVVTHFRLPFQHQFSCEQVNIVCDIRSQAAAFMLPWCCFQSFRHILATLEEVSTQLGIEYYLESGSCLGAVKLGNFIPWDIDMDIVFVTKYFKHFKPGGSAHALLVRAGISLGSFSEDMYHVKGAGSFIMHYGGITVEMFGEFTAISRSFLPPHLNTAPTRIQVGPELWVPVVSNPGLYSRGRYGPGYLYHVQSWRHKAGMGNSYDEYRPGGWAPCSEPGHQACLNNYPIQGNMELLSQIYP